MTEIRTTHPAKGLHGVGRPRASSPLHELSHTQGIGEEYDILLEDTREALLYWVRVTSGPVTCYLGYTENFPAAYRFVGEQIAKDLEDLR